MDYQSQRHYFARYQTVWLICAATLLVLASLLLRDLTLPGVCLLVAMVLVAASLEIGRAHV